MMEKIITMPLLCIAVDVSVAQLRAATPSWSDQHWTVVIWMISVGFRDRVWSYLQETTLSGSYYPIFNITMKPWSSVRLLGNNHNTLVSRSRIGQQRRCDHGAAAAVSVRGGGRIIPYSSMPPPQWPPPPHVRT